MKRALKFLPTFVAVAETGGVRAAAASLHKTQSAVSYDLKRLQEIAGKSLLVRSGRNLRLTDAGRDLLRNSRRLLDEFAAAVGGMAQSEPRAPLRVASVSGFGRYVAHPLLLAHCGARPLALRFFTNEDVLARVRDGEADLGFCFVRRPSRTLAYVPVYRERMVLIMPPTWRWRAGPSAWKALFDRHLAVTYDESDFVFGHWFSRVFGDPRRQLRIGDTFAELEEAIHAVSAGRGYSVVPADAAHALSRTARIRIAEGSTPVENIVYAVYRSGDAGDGAPALVKEMRVLLERADRKHGRAPGTRTRMSAKKR